MTIWEKILLVISILAFGSPIMGATFYLLPSFKKFKKYKEILENVGSAFFGVFILVTFTVIFVVFAMVASEGI